ncbi:MAG: flagellar basal body protein [Candidatus Puniceispirillales bacterium]
MLSILKSALNSNAKEMGIVSNNIANANSTGFKKVVLILNIFTQSIILQILISFLVKV